MIPEAAPDAVLVLTMGNAAFDEDNHELFATGWDLGFALKAQSIRDLDGKVEPVVATDWILAGILVDVPTFISAPRRTAFMYEVLNLRPELLSIVTLLLRGVDKLACESPGMDGWWRSSSYAIGKVRCGVPLAAIKY